MAMPGILKTLPLFVLLLAVLAGCASTPQAPRQRDAEAKQFITYPATAGIYIYRTDLHSDDDDDSVLYVDGRLIGATLRRTFFRVNVNPGTHLLNGMGPDQGSLRIETRPGQNYFVELNVVSGNSFFAVVEPQLAQRTIIACCELVENWAPGQRPLLR